MDFAFEGPLINRSIVESVGFPRKDFFIGYDDLEYSLRIKNLMNVKFALFPKAILIRKISRLDKCGRLRKSSWNLNWKFYCYGFRNCTYIHKIYGENLFVRMKPFVLFVLLCIREFPKLRNMKLLWDSLIAGYKMQ